VLVDLSDWVVDVIDALGYAGVALLVALENIFPPIPSEVVLPFAGVVARRGGATLPGMIAAATVGSVVGALALYGVAAAIGPHRLSRVVLRYGRWLRVTNDDIARAERWFDRRAVVAVLVGRCVPLIRSLVSIPAGFRRMPLVPFLAYTTVGSLVWNTGLISAGYMMGEEGRWRRVEDVMSYAQYAVVLGIVAAVGWFVWTRALSPTARRRRAEGADQAGEEAGERTGVQG